jgi:hypothetical protein
VSRQQLNDYFSFAICSLQLRAFIHIMSYMTTKIIIHEIIGLKVFFSVKTFQFILTPSLTTIINNAWAFCELLQVTTY